MLLSEWNRFLCRDAAIISTVIVYSLSDLKLLVGFQVMRFD